jgi:hypothetical protein
MKTASVKPKKMVLMDREKIFADEKPCAFLWCLHCQRPYKWGQFRLIDGLQMCPYEGCDGDTVMDGWEWKKICEANPDYPDVPELGKVYPLYRTSKNVSPEFRRFERVSKSLGGLMFGTQAAEVLGVSRQRFWDMVKAGQVHQQTFFGREYVSTKEILRMLEKDRKPGRPRKNKTIDKNT